MSVDTIADVVSALDGIVQQCERTQDRAGYFAALYKRMTAAVAQGITKGSFEDGPRMEKLDLIFAGRYLDAYHAYAHRLPCTASWQYAFDNCRDGSLTVIQQLITGINTHINLDLAIAASQVAPGTGIHALEGDFNKINDVISGLIDDVQECLSEVWLPVRALARIANHRHEPVLNFSIGFARKTAWANAVVLAGMDPAEQQQHILRMDGMVRKIGQKIHSPGMLTELLLKTIRTTEYNDVARTIRLIDTTIV